MLHQHDYFVSIYSGVKKFPMRVRAKTLDIPRRMRDRVHERHSPVSPYNIQIALCRNAASGSNIRRRMKTRI